MKDRTNFVVAVTFALALPIIIGGLYFRNNYISSLEKIKYASLDKDPEILYGEPFINGDFKSLNNKDNFYDFEVIYTDFLGLGKNYSLFLSDINLNKEYPKELLKWKLFFLDYMTNEYREVTSGDFTFINENKLNLIENVRISSNNIHKYRFYYYLDENNSNNDVFLKAQVTIE